MKDKISSNFDNP